jgi:hypothetical protein
VVPTLVIFVFAVVKFRQNKSPFAGALGDWFPFRTYFLTGNASPNNARIVIVIIIVIGEAESVLHVDGIIAQTYFPVQIVWASGVGSCDSVCFSSKKHPNTPAALAPITRSKNKTGGLNSNR